MNEIVNHFELYKAADGWRWRLIVDNNGKIIADSGQGYSRRADAIHGISLVAEHSSTPYIFDSEKNAWVE